MRDLRNEELLEVSGGRLSFLDQTNFHAQNGNGALVLPTVTVTGQRGSGGNGGAAFAFGFGGSDAQFTEVQQERGLFEIPFMTIPSDTEHPLCELSQLEGTCQLPNGTVIEDGRVVMDQEELEDVLRDTLSQIAFGAAVLGFTTGVGAPFGGLALTFGFPGFINTFER